ncbi:MAG: hypothetical protein U9P73_00075 [Candidatus Cloacimonadota bacterium]|nr:hypothetical protein [Candidatus Cloacimonadota bacterium]
MNFQKIIFLVLLLVVTISISIIVGSVFNENIFNINEYGFQFLIFSILGSFVFFTVKYLRNIDTFIVVIFISSLFAFLMRRTSLNAQVGGLFQLLIYAFMLFSVYTLIFRFTWFRFKYIRNITFSILEAIGYIFVHFILHILIKKPFHGQFILLYFLNGLKIMITLGVSFGIVEFINSKLEIMFFNAPERIFHKDNSEGKDDQDNVDQ